MPLDTKKMITKNSASISRVRSTLPGRDYHAPEIFELERERIFHDKWVCVGRQDWAVCERVQKGVRSRVYQSGIYPPNDQFVLEFNQRCLQERDVPG
jgi:phenylpropionate dioxygenase-like ring-hydroxylating dioxygenase large terminal subunit